MRPRWGGLDGVGGAGWRGPENTGQSLELLQGWLAPSKRAVEGSLEALSPVSTVYSVMATGKLHPPTAEPVQAWVPSKSWEGGS